MKRRTLILAGFAVSLVSACSPKSKFKTYRGPEGYLYHCRNQIGT